MKTASAPLNGPRDGDLVVARDMKSRPRYTVSRHPGAVQFSAWAREDAVRIARGLARRHGVDLWAAEGGVSRLLDGFREASGSDRS